TSSLQKHICRVYYDLRYLGSSFNSVKSVKSLSIVCMVCRGPISEQANITGQLACQQVLLEILIQPSNKTKCTWHPTIPVTPAQPWPHRLIFLLPGSAPRLWPHTPGLIER